MEGLAVCGIKMIGQKQVKGLVAVPAPVPFTLRLCRTARVEAIPLALPAPVQFRGSAKGTPLPPFPKVR